MFATVHVTRSASSCLSLALLALPILAITLPTLLRAEDKPTAAAPYKTTIAALSFAGASSSDGWTQITSEPVTATAATTLWPATVISGTTLGENRKIPPGRKPGTTIHIQQRGTYTTGASGNVLTIDITFFTTAPLTVATFTVTLPINQTTARFWELDGHITVRSATVIDFAGRLTCEGANNATLTVRGVPNSTAIDTTRDTQIDTKARWSGAGNNITSTFGVVD